MDNLTHSLAGLLIAEAAIQLQQRRAAVAWTSRTRSALAAVSMLAANLPDADLAYAGMGGSLGYLLHHRGHTHTVPAVLVGTALLWGVVALAWRWLGTQRMSRSDGWWVAALLFACLSSHLLLDWTNSYGVHPFWPIDNRWFYGDSVFIVEPWLWIASVPTLVVASRMRIARVLLCVVLPFAILLASRVSLVSSGALFGLVIGALASAFLTFVLRHRTLARTAAAVSAWIAVTLVFLLGARVARAAVVNALRSEPGSQLLDVVVSSMPANAICTSAIAVERVGSTYRVTTANVSALPSVTPASRCPENGRGADMPTTASRRSSPAVHWGGEWSAPVAELATLARESCPAFAALRFIRVPVWRALDDSTVAMGDARYGGTGGGGFTRMTVSRRSTRCPRGVPPWIPPRADILSP
ncbi:MAG TPA: metal-dependent hydrolase [Gemmatimonadaceae bacterium]|nr:metal-dependent hydrolase [Gemmatimonadaceae bacterium]